jgi:hypothetical protein
MRGHGRRDNSRSDCSREAAPRVLGGDALDLDVAIRVDDLATKHELHADAAVGFVGSERRGQ